MLSLFQELVIIVLSYTWASPFFINYIHGIQKWLCNRWCHRYVVDQAYITQSKINFTLKSLNKINRWIVLPLSFSNWRKHHRKDCCATLLYLHIPCIFHHSRCFDIQCIQKQQKWKAFSAHHYNSHFGVTFLKSFNVGHTICLPVSPWTILYFTYQHPPFVESSLHLLTLPHPKVCCDVPFDQSEIHFCHLIELVFLPPNFLWILNVLLNITWHSFWCASTSRRL